MSDRVWFGEGGPLNQRCLPRGRWGRVKFSADIVGEMVQGRRWGDIAALVPHLFVVATVQGWGELEVLAVSPDFDEISDGETAPLYDMWMEKLASGEVRWARLERLA